MTPTVSFIVPCYNLGHLLAECIDSILRQSYRNFELLVMDDCSPDATSDVVESFSDGRLRYVRNDPNLGHLRNYNKGIDLTSGRYIWLISADDCLRSPYVLERFVEVLNRHQDVGYVFCPAVRFDGDRDLYVYGSQGDRDAVFQGSRFLETLAAGNCVPAAAAMARRACYEQHGGFPLDLPFAGDWYLWARFALTFDVAYLGEPMVGWRLHARNMTHDFRQRPAALLADEMNVRWRLMRMAQASGNESVAGAFLKSLAFAYVDAVAQHAESRGTCGLTELEFEASLAGHEADSREHAAIGAVVYAALGDRCLEAGHLVQARERYQQAIERVPTLRTAMKYALVRAGRPGLIAGEAIRALRGFGRRSSPRHA